MAGLGPKRLATVDHTRPNIADILVKGDIVIATLSTATAVAGGYQANALVGTIQFGNGFHEIAQAIDVARKPKPVRMVFLTSSLPFAFTFIVKHSF